MKTIRVTGKGLLKLRPDTMRITVTLEGRSREYGDMLRRSSEDTEKIRSLLAGIGFARTDLKTVSFRADTEYEGYTDPAGVYRQRFAGYRSCHMMKVEFPSDNERLGKVLYALAHSALRPEFRISYTVGDREAAKNALLEKAVSDAAEKAALLSRAGGVALGDIQSIDYSWGELDLAIEPMAGSVLAKTSADAEGRYDLDMEPEDLELSDTVTVVWEIR